MPGDSIFTRVRLYANLRSRPQVVMSTPPVDGTFRVGSSIEPAKESKTWPNVANGVDSWLREKWPELVNIPGLWFTGSTVWSHVYQQYPPKDCDLDIFILAWPHGPDMRATEAAVKGALGVTDDDVGRTYLAGKRFITRAKGQVDFWKSDFMTPHHELLRYPLESHSHCRAAYSFHAGMVILPNEKAL